MELIWKNLPHDSHEFFSVSGSFLSPLMILLLNFYMPS
ncbi:unnamed protein product [Gulo gulo]|uniref:Uncharacterized protein n=1 Tax=Gulo gulo TaxID=48420 RepID=A0A9X9M9V7_GULGU|nr:unnamed protein product [Gulo gulo]